jgi:large subunit ribosomal protein L17
MRHGDRVKKLGRTREHRRALLKNLCRSLFILEKIKTTLPKAKAARQMAERLIEYAKRNDLAARRQIYRYVPDHKLVKIICDDIGPKYADRKGGYTRIYRMGPRLGDGAEMAILELVEQSDSSIIAQRRKLIERRQIAEAKKEKKAKEKKPKTDEKRKAEKKKKSEKTPKPKRIKKTKDKSK